MSFFCFINIILNNNYFKCMLIDFNKTINFFAIFGLHIDFKLNIYLLNIYIKKKLYYIYLSIIVLIKFIVLKFLYKSILI